MLVLSQDGSNIVTLENGTIQAFNGTITFYGNGAKCDLGNYNNYGRSSDYSIAKKVIKQIFTSKINGGEFYVMPKEDDVR